MCTRWSSLATRTKARLRVANGPLSVTSSGPPPLEAGGVRGPKMDAGTFSIPANRPSFGQSCARHSKQRIEHCHIEPLASVINFCANRLSMTCPMSCVPRHGLFMVFSLLLVFTSRLCVLWQASFGRQGRTLHAAATSIAGKASCSH